jgi:two-component system, NarL family, response regulator LiaR
MHHAAQTRVMIVDDNPAVRRSLTMALLAPSDITVVGEASDGEEALRVCEHLHPDVVLMDLQMPHLDGFSATRALQGHVPAPLVIILTTFLDDSLVGEALAAGAVGYLQKGVGIDELVRAIRAAQAKPAKLPSPAMHPSGQGGTGRPLPAPNGLTKREREVLTLVVAGRDTREIAKHLGITAATVTYHLQRICMRLGVASRAELGTQARQRHWVE